MQTVTHSAKHAMEIFKEKFVKPTGISPLTETDRTMLVTPASLQSITRTLSQGDNNEEISQTASILQELAADPQHRQAVAGTHGLLEALIRMLREPRGLKATRAAITTLYHLARDRPVRVRLAKAGAVPALLEILPEANKSVCERSLGVVDLLCNCEEGRAAAYEHALTVPVVVKKILRVSNLATEFAVSILCTLCRHSPNDCVMLNSLQAGAFQKLLLLLQLGCSENTRKRTTHLLKLFHHYREVWECVESSDFKEANRSF